MEEYDPLQPPNPEEWLAMDEGERILLVTGYHEEEEIELPNLDLHAAMHVAVENQIAMGEEMPIRTLKRLQQEGLDRHEAIHAIGSVLSKHMYNILQGGAKDSDPNAAYNSSLRTLTAKWWRKS